MQAMQSAAAVRVTLVCQVLRLGNRKYFCINKRIQAVQLQSLMMRSFTAAQRASAFNVFHQLIKKAMH